MPLHNWNDQAGWDGVPSVWIVELLRWIKPRLPADYRAYIGSTPALAVGALDERLDVSVREWPPELPGGENPPLSLPAAESAALAEPDEEIATLTLDPQKAVYVVARGRLV